VIKLTRDQAGNKDFQTTTTSQEATQMVKLPVQRPVNTIQVMPGKSKQRKRQEEVIAIMMPVQKKELIIRHHFGVIDLTAGYYQSPLISRNRRELLAAFGTYSGPNKRKITSSQPPTTTRSEQRM